MAAFSDEEGATITRLRDMSLRKIARVSRLEKGAVRLAMDVFGGEIRERDAG
jgi:hypothetical protein